MQRELCGAHRGNTEGGCCLLGVSPFQSIVQRPSDRIKRRVAAVGFLLLRSSEEQDARQPRMNSSRCRGGPASCQRQTDRAKRGAQRGSLSEVALRWPLPSSPSCCLSSLTFLAGRTPRPPSLFSPPNENKPKHPEDGARARSGAGCLFVLR
jgi:hypothetical protein